MANHKLFMLKLMVLWLQLDLQLEDFPSGNHHFLVGKHWVSQG